MTPQKALSVFSAIASVLLFLALGLGIYGIIAGVTEFSGLILGMLLLTTLFGLYYVLAGCKKAAGIRYFGAFLNFFALSELFLLLGVGMGSRTALFLLTLCFAVLVLLAGARDLGRKKSICLSLLVIVLCAACFGRALSAGTLAEDWQMYSVNLALAFSTYLMLLSKYADKATRGSK